MAHPVQRAAAAKREEPVDIMLNHFGALRLFSRRVSVPSIRRALLVASDFEKRHLMSHVLQSEGFVVVEVPSASALLYRLVREASAGRDTSYDVIVGDVEAFDGCGMRALSELRVIRAELAVVLVKSPQFDRPRDAATRVGVTLLERPIDIERLRGVVRTLIPGRAGEKPALRKRVSTIRRVER
jgi:DNA-binding response OmpR family regulator